MPSASYSLLRDKSRGLCAEEERRTGVDLVVEGLAAFLERLR